MTTVALWITIAEDLRRRILDQEWEPGEQIPSQRDLAAAYGNSLATISRAISKLIAERYLESDPKQPTRGTRVARRQDLISSSRDRLTNMAHTGRATGAGETARIVSSELIPASEHIARSMGVEPGERVIVRHRIHLADGMPIQLSTSHLPGEFAELIPGLLSMEKISGGTMGALAKLGKVVAHVVGSWAAFGASAAEAAALGIAEGAPVQYDRNWWRADDGQVLEYGESVTREGWWQSMECPAPAGR